MSKIYFYPDINYQDIKHIEKAHSVLNDKLLITRAVNIIYESIINLIDKTDSILFICGPGNNGLDALFTAKKLTSDNYKVDVFITDKLKTTINNNDYKKETSLKYLIFDLIEFYFNKIQLSKSYNLYDKYSYFMKKISDTRRFNLDEESLFIEFEEKILNG